MALTQVKTPGIAADAVTGAKVADDQINSEHYVAASIDHEHLANDCVDGDNIADNSVGLAAMAGVARGALITGDSSGDPKYLSVGSDNQVLTVDSNGDIGWEAASGGATINNATENEIVTVASTTTQLDAEANLTFNGEHLTLGDGNLVIGTSGHGIDFSATADGPQLSHASELFDDYEEGTFDVAFNGNVAGNTGQNKAQYVKIGRVCHIAGQVHLDSSGNTDNVEINNLPFASSHSLGEGSGQQHALGGAYELNHADDTVGVRWYIGDNTQTAKLIDMRDNAGWTQVAAVASKYIWMTMSYITE